MSNVSENLDPQRQKQAREYAAIGRWFYLFDLVFGVIYLIMWIVSGLAPWLRDQIHTNLGITAFWLTVPLFAIGFSLPQMILTAPLEVYRGFILPHRYGQSTQSLGSWLWDQLKGLILSSILGLVLLVIIYGLLYVAPMTWWLWAVAVLLIFSVLLSNLAPVLIFPLFFKYESLTDETLVNRLTHLAEQAGTRVQGVYTFDMSSKTVAANAALMGLGNTRRIVLGDTLVNNFSVDEIETVLAHELGHHVHRDLVWGILVQSSLTVVGFWLADLVLRWGISWFGYQGLTDPATLPLFMLAMMFYGLVTQPIGNLWSRWREVKADRYALEMTAKPQAFISAMTRLANQNLAEVAPPAWVEFLLHSHPSIERRVAMAEAYQAN